MFYLLAVCAIHLIAAFITSARFLRPANRTEHLLFAGFVAYISFYLVPLVIGWISGAMNGVTIGAGAFAGVLASAMAIRWGEPSDWKMWRWGSIRVRPWFEWVVWALIFTLLLLLLIAGLVLPVRAYDAPAYHMSNPMRWHQTGKFILDSFGAAELSPQLMSAECAPNMKAIWPFAVLLFTKGIAGTAFAQFPFFLLLITAVRAMALRLGVTGWLASLAVLTVIATPEIVLQSVEAYADLVFVCGQIVLVWSLVYLWQSPFGWRSIAFPAIGFSILFGAKAAALASGGLLGIFYGGLLLWRGWQSVRWRTPVWVAVALFLTVAGIGASGGPWFYHAYNEYGNPVYPFALELGGKTIFPGPMRTDVNTPMLIAYTGASGTEAYWNTLREIGRTPALSNWSGGLGANMFILGLPSLALLVLSTLLPFRPLAARLILITAFLLLSAATPTIAIARFSLFQPILAAVAFAWILTVIPRYLRYGIGIVALAFAGYNAYMALPSLQYQRKTASHWMFHLVSGFPRASQLDVYPDQYTSLDFWREEVSGPGKKLGIHPHHLAVWYTYAPWSPGDVIRFRMPQAPVELKIWHQDLLLNGVTHLYLQRGDSAWDMVLNRPDLFPLLMRRLDNHWAPMNGGIYVGGWPEDALFAVAGGEL